MTAPHVAFASTLTHVTLTPVLDTTVDSAEARPHNAEATLFISFSPSDNRVRRALLLFDLATIPANATVNNATLTLRQTAASGAGSVTLTAARATEQWHGTAVWPGPGVGAPTAPLIVDLGLGDKPWNVTELVAAWVSGQMPNFGFVLQGPETGERYEHAFASAETGEQPVLVVDYTLPPETHTPTPTLTNTPAFTPMPTTTPIATPTSVDANLVIFGTEVSQGLPNYPLVAGKTTLVRIYTASSLPGVPVQVDSAVLDVTRANGASFTVNASIPNPSIANGNQLYSENANLNFYVPGTLISEDAYSFSARLYRCNQPPPPSQAVQAALARPCLAGATLIRTVTFNNPYNFWRTDDIRLMVVMPDWARYGRPLSELALLSDYLDDLARVFPVRDGWGNIGDAKGLQVVLRIREPVCDGTVGVIDCRPDQADLDPQDPIGSAITAFTWNLVQPNPAGERRTLCQDSNGTITPAGGVPCQSGAKPFRYINDGLGGFATQLVPDAFLRTGGWTPNTAESTYDLNDNGRIDVPTSPRGLGDVGYYVAEFSNDGGATWLTDLRQVRPGALVHSFIDTNRDGRYEDGEPVAPVINNMLVSWMFEKATLLRDRYNALNPNSPPINYAAFVIWPGMDRSGTGPGQASPSQNALWAWLDRSPGFHQELGHLFGLVAPSSPNYDGGGHSRNWQVNNPRGFDILRRKALAAPWNSVMAGGLYSPYTNALMECAEYTQVFNQLKLSPNAPPYPLSCTTPPQPTAALLTFVQAAASHQASDNAPELALDLYLTHDDHLKIAHSHVTSGLLTTPLVSDSTYALVFLAADQRVLANDAIAIVFEPPLEQAHHGTTPIYHHNTFVHIVRPLPADTAIVELRHGDHILAHLIHPAHAPTVHIHPVPAMAANLDSQAALTGTIALTWDAAHPDGVPLTYDVAYSADGGTTWQPIASGYVSTTLQWDSTGVSGASNALVRVEASDGFNTTSATSDASFPIAAKPPVVNIISPNAGTNLPNGQPLLLRGAAFDLQDGAVTEAALRWSSSVDGELGSGSEVEVTLTPGRHTLTLRATNRRGLTSSTQMAVFVGSQVYLPLIDR